ncbi:DUF4271 domain-containing protein [Pseudozobellia thermophila]|uniref:DUF4271 domain-containing protein n=1 Tax=Pseudozobellia thermophila TaxID=192903 RepID=A0A1M6AH20_9FLAO|nr:DUF4271 domain-containing protein [Pseudozobellia thermophila]SHI35814.1 protein of unknown function [Pseudozobellia thermophila]
MEPILRTAGTADWMTIILVASLLFLVLAKRLFYTRFLNFIILPFNNKYIFLYNKKEKLVNWFHILFTVFQTTNFALFVYLARKTIAPPNDEYPFMYLIILGFILLFLLVKTTLQLANGYIFGSNKVVSEVIFKKLSYFNYSGIVMFMANLLIVYVVKTPNLVIYGAILLILLINIIGWVTVLRNHQKFIANYFFYFILYLCALEISPFIIIGGYLQL